MYAKTTPPKKKPSALPRKSALALTNASVISSPLGTKTFNFTMHGDDEEDYGGGLSPPKFNSGKKKKKKHANLPGDLDFGDAHGNEVADAKAEAEEQAKLVAEMLGEEMNAGDLAAEYGMSESSEEEPEEETKEEAKGEAKEFDWSEQMGPQMVSDLQEQNQTLKSELDSKKGQLKKMGIMLNALEPIPGVDAEKLMQALDHKGDPLMKDMKDVKIITMAKKIKGLSFEVNKQKSMNRKAEQALLLLDKELTSKQTEIDSLATPAARAAIAKTLTQGVASYTQEFNATQSSLPGAQAKKLQHNLDDMRHKFEVLKEKNRVMEQKLLQEVGGDQKNTERMDKIMEEGWKGRSQQIIMLKSKMKRMEAEKKMGGSNGGMSAGEKRVASNNLKKDVDFRAQQELKEMDKAKQAGLEHMNKAFDEMKDKCERVEKKLQGAKVRVGCLETDNTKMRDGMKVFVGKASTDDKLVDMLKAEVVELKKNLKRGAEREREARIEGRKEGGGGDESVLLKSQVSQLMSQNAHQERIINQLRAEAYKMRNPGKGVGVRVARGERGGGKEAEEENDSPNKHSVTLR